MSGNNGVQTEDEWAKKAWTIIEKGIKDAQPVILANTQAFEEKIANSYLDEALEAIREEIGMPKGGFESSMEANLWLRGRFVSENVRAERMERSEWWMNFIQMEFGLTDNYQSAIRSYLFTGKIDHIQGNAVVEFDAVRREVRVVTRDHIRDAEKPFLKKLSELLLTRVGQTAKRFTLTSHRAIDPKKHAEIITALRMSKQKTAMGLTDIDIVDAITKNDSPIDATQFAEKEKKALSSVRNIRYNKKKRRSS